MKTTFEAVNCAIPCLSLFQILYFSLGSLITSMNLSVYLYRCLISNYSADKSQLLRLHIGLNLKSYKHIILIIPNVGNGMTF